MKKTHLIILIAALMFFGCATHSTIKQPNLNSHLEAQQNKQILNQVEIMARPILSKSENKAYYDEDLILWGVLPFHVCFKNNDPKTSCDIDLKNAELVDPDGSSNPALTFEQVYGKASKSYGRALGWGVAFGLLGAIPSVINVAVVNEKIKADYESCMIKNGALVAGGYTEGSMFFSIDKEIQSLDGWKLQLGYNVLNDPKLVTFDLSGDVEQPRVPEQKVQYNKAQ